MRKLVFLLILFLLNLSLGGCKTLPNEPPENFGFIFKYGIGAKNILNTFDHHYTKDMVVDPPLTVDLLLTKEQLTTIYKKMLEIDFFNYPDEFNPEGSGGVTPVASFYFKVRVGTLTKEVNWDDVHISEAPEAIKLRELMNLIDSYIINSPEYKKIPEPRGGYL